MTGGMAFVYDEAAAEFATHGNPDSVVWGPVASRHWAGAS